MADLSTMKLIDLTLLTTYDVEIKEYIKKEAGDAAAASIKTVAVDTSNDKHVIKFYKELSTDITETTVPAFSVDLSDLYDDVADLQKAVDLLNDDATVAGSVAYSILQATGELGNKKEAEGDTPAVPYANVKDYVDTKNKEIADILGSDVLTTTSQTVKGAINELDSEIGDMSAVEVETESGTKAGTVVEALNQLESEIGDLTSDSKVTMTTAETATDGYLKTYVFTQGSGDDAVEIGKVDIPKDYLVTKFDPVKVVEEDDKPVEGYKVGDKYITLFINTLDGSETDNAMYIKVSDFAKALEAEQDATQIQLTISDDNVISGEIVDGSVDTDALGASAVTEGKISDDAVTTSKIKDANVTADKLAENAVTVEIGEDGTISSTVLDDTVVDALNKAETAIQEENIVFAEESDILNLFKKTSDEEPTE